MDYEDDLLDISHLFKIAKDREWMKDAACKGMDANLFFPERGDIHSVRHAKEVCSTCKVVEQCKDYGTDEIVGIWGGTSAKMRRVIRREKAKA